MYSDETASGSAGDRQTPLASANARSGGPSRATTTVLVSRASGSFGGKAKSRSSSDSRNATVPQRSQVSRRLQPRHAGCRASDDRGSLEASRPAPDPSPAPSPRPASSFPPKRARYEERWGGKEGGRPWRTR